MQSSEVETRTSEDEPGDPDSSVSPPTIFDGLLDAVSDLMTAEAVGELHRLSDTELTATTAKIEEVARRLYAVQVMAAGAIEDRGIARSLASVDSSAFLSLLLRINHQDAAGRLRAAAQGLPPTSSPGHGAKPELHLLSHVMLGPVADELCPGTAARAAEAFSTPLDASGPEVFGRADREGNSADAASADADDIQSGELTTEGEPTSERESVDPGRSGRRHPAGGYLPGGGFLWNPQLIRGGGLLSAGHVDVITRMMSDIPTEVDQGTRDVCERVILGEAMNRTPHQLKAVAKQILLAVDPDGKLDDEKAHQRMRLDIGTRNGNGLTPLHGLLDDLSVEQLRTVIESLAAPKAAVNGVADNRSASTRRAHALAEAMGHLLDSAQLPTVRKERPQVMMQVNLHDLLADLAAQGYDEEWLARATYEDLLNTRGSRPQDRPDRTQHSESHAGRNSDADLAFDPGPEFDADPEFGADAGFDADPEFDADPDPRSEPVPVADATNPPSKGRPERGGLMEDDEHDHPPVPPDAPITLPRRWGSARLSWGGPISAVVARMIACDAKVIPVVMGSLGEVLDVGQQQYSFPRAIRRAITVRDKGCTWPGCDRPPPWCDAHHVVEYLRGGPTSLENGALLCGFHHREIHKGHWQIVFHSHRPYFVPPKWIDPAQYPRRNQVHDVLE